MVLKLQDDVMWDPEILMKRLEACAAIRNDRERLSAYDQLSSSLGIETAKSDVALPSVGGWLVRHETNPMDDTQTVFASLKLTETRSLHGEPHRLIVRVQSYRTEVFVVWNEYIQSQSPNYGDDWVMVTTRVGRSSPQTLRWSLSEDSQATFMPEPVVQTLRQMASASTFALQTSVDGKLATAVFDITGMSEALQPASKAGGWRF